MLNSVLNRRLLALCVVLLAAGTALSQSFNKLYDFPGTPEGGFPSGRIVSDSSGNLYVADMEGGAYSHGAIEQFSPPATVGGTWTAKVVYSFTGGSDGYSPFGGLAIDRGGNLYGATEQGGCTRCYGTVFKLKPPTTAGGAWAIRTLHAFIPSQTDGGIPVAGVIVDSKGVVWGTTVTGGFNTGACQGTVFKITPSGPNFVFSLVWSFGVSFGDACSPQSPLLIDSAGNIYGTAVGGGSAGLGAVYKISPTSSTSYVNQILYSFPSTTGQSGYYPQSGLVLDSQGNLWGTTTLGGCSGIDCGGTVFRLKPPASGNGSWTFNLIYTFRASNGGGTNPYNGLLLDTATGTFYGTTVFDSGPDNCGALFQLTKPVVAGQPWNYTVLHSFLSADGCTINSLPFRDAAGNLYVTGNAGGLYNNGTLVEVTP